MILEFFPAGLALVAVCIANYTDLRNRLIPNKLTYPLIVVGIAFYLSFGAYHGEFFRALFGAFGAALAFGIGYLLYLTGGWAGGDVKLFTALGALLPVYEAPHTPPYSTAYPLFPLTLLFNSVIAAAPVLLAYALISRATGRGAFYETVKFSELKEGMIPAEVIYEKDDEVERWDPGHFGFLSRAFGKPDWDRQLTDPSKAAGISRYYVGVLRRLAREGKLENRIKIKKGVPFAPAVGVGVFIGVFYGGLYWGLLTFFA